jgi:D-beta-D-heptose 7-phosphate kinase/D-beta-D-heptose 1-phosphate adenosyltransferase
MSKILVFGDICIDHTIFTEKTNKISQEDKNCPITKKVGRDKISLGMAANVAKNIAVLEKAVMLCTYSDLDDRVIDSLIGNNIDYTLLTCPYPTTIKQRIYVADKQTLRIDSDQIITDHVKISREEFDFLDNIEDVKYAIISDYQKGTCANIEEVINYLKDLEIFVIIDPKGNDWSKYSKADIIKSNRKELQDVYGKELYNPQEFKEAIEFMMKKLNLSKLIVTNGSVGVYICENIDGNLFFDSFTPPIIDYKDECGAGDTFIASLTTSLYDGLEFSNAAHFAMMVASISCMYYGTYAPNKDEILEFSNK